MNTSTTITKIAAALLAAQKTMGSAVKGTRNPFFKSTYADLNSIREIALPALNAQGVTVLQPTVASPDGKNYVETVLLHESGEFISGVTEIINTKGDAQGNGSGISYSRRYGLQSLLNIGAVDDDGEEAVGRKTYVLTKPEVQTKEVVVAANQQIKVSATTGNAAANQSAVPANTGLSGTNGSAKNTTKAKPTKETLKAAFEVLKAQKKTDADLFKTTFLNGVGLSKLTDDQAAAALTKVSTSFPELQLN